MRVSGVSSKVVAPVKGTLGQTHYSETFLLLFPSFLPCTPPSLYSFNKHLLSTYCVRQVPGVENTVVNKAVRVPALMELGF